MTKPNIDIENLLYSFYIKYTDNTLGLLTQSSFPNSTATNVDIYIDLYSVINTVKRNSAIINLHPVDTTITSSILNMCIHYRAAFKRFGVYARIFLVYSENKGSMYQKWIPGYNKDKYTISAELQNNINTNLSLVEILSHYIPDIHYINSTYEVGAVMLHLMYMNKDIPSIVITKDNYLSSIVTCRSQVALFRPLYTKQQQASYAITKDNFWERFSYQRDLKVPINTSLSPELISCVNMLCRIPERGIKGLVHIPTAIKTLESLIEQNIILNQYVVPYSNFTLLLESILKIGNALEYENRFKAVDLRFQQQLFADSVESKTIVLDNLYDPGNLNMLLNKYFSENPIEVNKL